MDTSNTILQKIGWGTISTIIVFLTILNVFSGIIGGVWLTFSGGIGIVIMGIIMGVVMPWVYTIAFLPTMLIIAPLTKASESRNLVVVSILGFILTIYQTVILTFWIIYVFGIYASYWKQYPIVALFLCGYSTMMAPLGYMASKEGPDSHGTTFALLLAQILYIVVAIMWFFNLPNRLEVLGVCIIAYSLFMVYVLNKTISQNDAFDQSGLSPNPNLIQEGVVIEQKKDETSPKYCNRCGKNIINLATFCSKCGNKL